MCLIAVKYIPKFGWVGAKNRDRNYPTEIEVVQSNRNGLQRIYIDDKLSRWTEGVNEFGVAIISASFSVKSDEKEGDKVANYQSKRAQANFYSPDGKSIRKALELHDPKKAANFLVEAELAGATYIFNSKKCYLLEGGYTVKKENATKENPREYIHSLKEILPSDGLSVRTNHGIDAPELGYMEDPSDPKLVRARKSSETRLKHGMKFVKMDMVDPSELLDAIAKTPDSDPFMNPIRTGNVKRGDMVTTGQLLLVPKERSLAYRPIYSKVSFDYTKLNGPESKTFFEIISSRKLLSFKEFSKDKK